MKTYVATKNAGKLGELRAIFSSTLLELETYGGYADVEEDASSYAGNALRKAHALARQLRDDGIVAAVLADDSGLEVDELGGRPGVLSARYGGAELAWPQRRALLLRELEGLPEERRSARFVCVLALALPDADPITAIGVTEGRIVSKERGTAGFGYDPLFLYPASGCTFAEISAEEKNAISHRYRAGQGLLALLRGRL